jgi:hypothetical protein
MQCNTAAVGEGETQTLCCPRLHLRFVSTVNSDGLLYTNLTIIHRIWNTTTLQRSEKVKRKHFAARVSICDSFPLSIPTVCSILDILASVHPFVSRVSQVGSASAVVMVICVC